MWKVRIKFIFHHHKAVINCCLSNISQLPFHNTHLHEISFCVWYSITAIRTVVGEFVILIIVIQKVIVDANARVV